MASTFFENQDRLQTPVKIFISHAHKDQTVAQILVDYLSSSYELDPREIRCTSIPENDLSLGESIADQLREDVSQQIGFIALLSYFGLESTWVKFELGAAWSTRQFILPVLGPKINLDDPRLGPVGFMYLLTVDDRDCLHKLKIHLGRMVEDMKIATRKSGENLGKLEHFVEMYRNFGGQNADFTDTQSQILSPASASSVGQVITVKMDLKGVPVDGSIWVAVANTKTAQLWPKESLQDSFREGQHSIEINENGNPEPGTLAIVIIGVGPAGNEMLKDWRRRAEQTGNWAGIKSSEIRGYTELSKVDQLTLLRH